MFYQVLTIDVDKRVDVSQKRSPQGLCVFQEVSFVAVLLL